eukprot:Skav211059  [mRNA]  locus=scaffold314:40324:42610:+ [translate_table: standard]
MWKARKAVWLNQLATAVLVMNRALRDHGGIRGKTSDVEKSTNFASSLASDLAGSYMRSSDGLGADGELTPGTKKTALEAMKKVLNRTEFTPRTVRDFDEEDMEVETEE